MCAIFGLRSKAAPVRVDTVARAIEAVAHRGPDDQQIWIDPTTTLALAHRRLSIIDLDGGRQPIASEDGRVRAIVNGELYGFEAIRRSLVARGHRFSTASDSEILIHLFEEHDTDCLRYLRGEFAFVLWDERTRRLIAARDRFGIKPLFYVDTDAALMLGSEIKSFFAAGHPATWDLESVHQAAFVFVEGDRTLFRDVRQVPPGAMLIADDRGTSIAQYWDLCYPRIDHQSSADEPAIDELSATETVRALVHEAVEIRLRADVPVSSFLSGGLDSSAVFGVAAQRTTRLQGFTVAFCDEAYDETTVAEATAAHHRARLRIVPVGSDDMAAHFRDTVVAGETLGVNWHGVARYLLCRAIHDEGYKVALAGEGGDELFGGYVQLRQDALVEPYASPLAHAQAGSHASAGRSGDDEMRLGIELQGVRDRLGYVPCWIRKIAEARRPFRVALADSFLREMAGRNPYATLVSAMDTRQLEDRDRVHQSSYLWIRSVLANYILFAERLEMAHAVETRLPLLDHVLFEYVRTLPRALLLHGASEKFVLREAARPVLTNEVYRRTKHPFFAPPASDDGADAQYRLLREILTTRALADVPFVDAAAVEMLLASLPRLPEHRRLSVDSLLLMIASACVLQQAFHVGT
jgi:asparagine synthase (glutamine-hydrolysing)